MLSWSGLCRLEVSGSPRGFSLAICGSHQQAKQTGGGALRPNKHGTVAGIPVCPSYCGHQHCSKGRVAPHPSTSLLWSLEASQVLTLRPCQCNPGAHGSGLCTGAAAWLAAGPTGLLPNVVGGASMKQWQEVLYPAYYFPEVHVGGDGDAVDMVGSGCCLQPGEPHRLFSGQGCSEGECPESRGGPHPQLRASWGWEGGSVAAPSQRQV